MSVQRVVFINDSGKFHVNILEKKKGGGGGGGWEGDCAYHGDYQLGVYVL